MQPSTLHDLVRSLFPRERLSMCGRALRYGSSGVCVYRTPSGALAYRGLYRCGDYWRCPSCAVTLGVRRSAQVSSAASQHIASGGSLALLTLTIPHSRDDALSLLLGRLVQSWRVLGKVWRRVLPSSFAGYVRSLEVTHGVSGWHPHYHVLLFFDQVVDAALMMSLVAVKREWCAVSGADVADARIVADGDVSAVASYIVKRNVVAAACEVARSPNKVARGRTYWNMLVDYAMTQSPVDLRYITEYASALHGVHHITVSSSLRRRYDFADPSSGWGEISDDQVVMTMTIDDYRAIADSEPGLSKEFLASLGTSTD